jgi:hypothetical protein
MNSYAFKFGNAPVELADLPKDLKRVLKVQFREFIHFVEDAQEMSEKRVARPDYTQVAA